MTSRLWNEPRLRQIGLEHAERAYDLADELNGYGADAKFLLLDKQAQRKRLTRRPADIAIPTMLADVIMAVLLALPRPKAVGRRRGWSPDQVQKRIDNKWSLRASAKQEAVETGVPVETIERAMRARRANAKQPPKGVKAKAKRRR
jgi:hypothetical protein